MLQWTFQKICANLQTSYKDNCILFINSFSHGFRMGLALSEPGLNPAHADRSCIFLRSDFIDNERTTFAWHDDERKEAVASLSTRSIEVRCQDAVAARRGEHEQQQSLAEARPNNAADDTGTRTALLSNKILWCLCIGSR